MSYSPQAGSLADRVCNFFRQQPDEELSARDVAQKFDSIASSVSALLSSAYANGLIARRKDDAGTTVYVAGPKLASAPAPAPAPASRPAASAAATPAKGRRAPLPTLDVTALVVRRDVVDPGRVDSKRAAYFAALDLLDAPRAAIDIDKRYRGAIAKAAQDYLKQDDHKAKRFAFRSHPTDPSLCLVLREA